MMDFPITVELRETNLFLARIATALERLAGPVIDPDQAPILPHKSGLADYHITSPAEQDAVKQAHADFARAHMLMPGSEAAMAVEEAFNRAVQEAKIVGED